MAENPTTDPIKSGIGIPLVCKDNEGPDILAGLGRTSEHLLQPFIPWFHKPVSNSFFNIALPFPRI